MSEDLEPLGDDVLAVLAQLGPVKDAPRASRARIWNAVEARVAMVGTLPGRGASPGAGGVSGRAPARGALGSWIARNPWFAVTGAALIGGALGVGARGLGVPGDAGSTVPAVRPQAMPPTAETTMTSPSASAPWMQVAPETSAASVPPMPRPAAPTPAAGQELAAESAILDIARTAIARGEADHALAAVDRHASTFPHGVLREEREALGVKALVLAGHGEEARARAARFRAKYPESLFLPALESSLRSIP